MSPSVKNSLINDDYRCEASENAKLLLQAVKSKLRKSEQRSLAAELPDDPLDVVELGVCSIKNLECIWSHINQSLF